LTRPPRQSAKKEPSWAEPALFLDGKLTMLCGNRVFSGKKREGGDSSFGLELRLSPRGVAVILFSLERRKTNKKSQTHIYLVGPQLAGPGALPQKGVLEKTNWRGKKIIKGRAKRRRNYDRINGCRTPMDGGTFCRSFRREDCDATCRTCTRNRKGNVDPWERNLRWGEEKGEKRISDDL